jgi:hypothetical protein
MQQGISPDEGDCLLGAGHDERPLQSQRRSQFILPSGSLGKPIFNFLCTAWPIRMAFVLSLVSNTTAGAEGCGEGDAPKEKRTCGK